MKKIIFERKKYVYVNSKRSQQKDFLIIKNLMSREVLSLPRFINITVKEVGEDIDLTLNKNRYYKKFYFFKKFDK